jgi:hypothetical protein
MHNDELHDLGLIVFKWQASLRMIKKNNMKGACNYGTTEKCVQDFG